MSGGPGADRFVFDRLSYNDATATPALVDYLMDYDQGDSGAYNVVEGDQIDVSPLVAAAFGAGQVVGTLARVVEGGDGDAALLQVDVDGTGSAARWVTLAEFDDIHFGNTVNLILNSSQPAGTTLTPQGNFASSGRL